jgi:hypothetical protein
VGSPIDTLTLPAEPLCATATWRAAVKAAGGLCQCAGACGRKHTATKGACDQYQGLNDLNLHLAEDGEVYCPRCFGPIMRAFAKAAAEVKARAAADRYAQGDLFSLFGGEA